MEHDPYSAPTVKLGSVPTEGQSASRRSIGEIVVLLSLVGFVVFWGYLIAFGSLKLSGQKPVVVAVVTSFLGLGILSLWLVARRRIAGAVACMVFYGIQIVSVTFSSGDGIGFNSLPAIYFRIYGDEATPTNINIVALILFVLSVMLWRAYQAAPDTSQEHTHGR